MANIIQNLSEMVRLFSEIGTRDPISAILLLTGAALVGFSSLVMAYLSAGAVVDLFTRE